MSARHETPSHVTPPTPRGPDATEEWMRAVVDHAQDVLTAVDAEGRILYDSPSVLHVLGYPQGELVGRSAFELIHPDDIPAAIDLLSQTAAGAGAASSLVYRFRHGRGGWVVLESVGVAISGSIGVAVIVTSRDVTRDARSIESIRRALQGLASRAEGGTSGDAMQMEMLQRLARAAEIRDDETGRHTRRVATLAARLAAAIGLDPDQARIILRAAPLHDIGKIGVPDEILLKRGPLTVDEISVMRTHTTLGGRILSGGSSELMRTAESIALYHHERWDGGGYPSGMSGPDIPLPARVVAVADFFDALSHDRPYRPAMSAEQVSAAIADGAGSHFDPDVARAFLALGHAAGAAGIVQ